MGRLCLRVVCVWVFEMQPAHVVCLPAAWLWFAEVDIFDISNAALMKSGEWRFIRGQIFAGLVAPTRSLSDVPDRSASQIPRFSSMMFSGQRLQSPWVFTDLLHT